MNTEFQFNPMQPIDYIAWLALIIVLIVSIYAIYNAAKEYSAQMVLITEAFELVDSTFAATWDGDRNLEFYAWTVTSAKLNSSKNPFVNQVLKTRIREAEANWKPKTSTKRETLWLPRPTI